MSKKLWTKVFVYTSLVNFILTLSMALLLVTMASYAINKYDLTTGIGGLVASVFIIGVLIGRLYAGKKILHVKAKSILFIGTSVFVITSIGYFFDFGVYGLMLIRILQGIGLGFATTATGTIVAQVIPLERKSEGISYFSISVVLSTALGPFIGIQLINFYDYISIFIFSTIIGVIGLIMVTMLKVPDFEIKENLQIKSKFNFDSYFEKKAIPISFVLFILGLGYASILSFIMSYADEINLTSAGGYFFLIYSLVIIISRPFTGKIMDNKGANSVVYPAIILFALGMFLLSIAKTPLVLLLSAVLIGAGYGNFQSCSQAIAISLTPVERYSLANSTYFIFLDIALGLGPLLLGLLEPLVGYRGMYGSLVIVIIVGFIAYHFLYGKKQNILLSIQEKEEAYEHH